MPPRALLIEPFHAGSHAAFVRALTAGLPLDWTSLTLPGRHWKWRMRGAAPFFTLRHAATLRQPFDLLIATSYLPLAEFLGLNPQLAHLPSLLYFHENQLAYPVREEHSGPRDHHFGFTQLVSALAASACAFNSAFNRDSFLSAADNLLRALPDAIPPGWLEAIAARSHILPLPLDLPDLPDEVFLDTPDEARPSLGPLILWNHRWEYDKNPDTFFEALRHLKQRGLPFRLALAGQRFGAAPPAFEAALRDLDAHIIQRGHADADTYRRLLTTAHLAISTAHHEFFGISMLEAAHCGAFPLVPDRLAYPEHFPAAFRYADDAALPAHLAELVGAWLRGDLDLRARRDDLTRPFLPAQALPPYLDLVHHLLGGRPAQA